ncbi:MAG: WD40 repeat domain-containing protein [Anaerolineae bacterium]|nr:WD40 repeat domain-containing protein [Anaerolineae bacterium]
MEPKGREVYDLAWSPSGMLIAAGHEVFGSGPGYAYPMVQIWDTISGQLLLTPTSAPDFYDEIHALAWSTDSRLAGGSLEGILYIWQLTIKSGEEATWETLATLEGHEGTITAAAWSPDGTRLVSASEDGRIRIWDVERGDAVATLESHAQDFEEIVWSPDGKQLLSSSWNGEIWDAVTGERLTLARGFRRVGGRNWSIAWSVNGPYLADRDDDVIRVQNVSTGEALARFEMKNYSIYHIALSPNGTFLMGEDTRRDVCIIWDVSSGERIAILNSGEWWLEKLTWSWDETRIAGGHGDGQVFIWDVQNGERLATLHADDDRVWAIAWSPDDRYLATSGLRDSIIRIWDTVSWEEVTSFGRFSFFLAWSPDGTRLIASAGNDGMRLWDTRSWEQVAVLEGHQSEIQSVAWSPDGTRVASASWDGTIRVWERQ